jgi:hypothetical protein
VIEQSPTPEEESDVTRLLRDASAPAPMPPDVAARLDDVLAGLVREREAPPATADPVVVPLRRRWPQVLVAAAAVVLVGYGGANLLHSPGSRSAESTASAGSDTKDLAQPETSDQGAEAPQGDAGAPSVGHQELGNLFDLSGRVDSLKAIRLPVPTSDSVSGTAGGFTRQDQGLTLARVPASGCDVPALARHGSSLAYALGKQRFVVVAHDSRSQGPLVVSVYRCHDSLFPVATRVVLGAR